MPRQSRIDAPGALQHLMGRGIDRRHIFLDKTDYDDFIDRLARLFPETGTSCYAWSLMPNHFHLLLKTGSAPISRVMQRLLTGYVVGFNRRHRRVGHLFQNRYKSILCQEEAYLLELVRYIHLNPLRAGLVSGYDGLAHYPYCGHRVILGRQAEDWQDASYVLRSFGNRAGRARQRYGEFVRAGIEKGRRTDLTGGGLLRSQGGWAAVTAMRQSGEYQKGDERILGDGDFVEEVLSRAEEDLIRKYRLAAEGYDLDRLIERVSELVDMEPEEIVERGKDKRKVVARSILCFWATDFLGLSQTELARQLGLTQPSVSQAVQRGKKIVRERSYALFDHKML